MIGTKWIDKGDGRIMTFAHAGKYISLDSVIKGKDVGKYDTKDVVVLIDDLTESTIVMDVALFFLQLKPLAVQPDEDGQVDDWSIIN